MTAEPPQHAPSRRRQAAAYGVHLLTAAGIVPAFFAAVEIASAQCDSRIVFLWLIVAVAIDAVDGPLARRLHVKTYADQLDGRTIDDIVDYITFTFLPLLLVWRMAWTPTPAWVFVLPAMVASLLGFAHVGAKEEAAGFFRGFPSYWNIAAFYCGLLAAADAAWVSGAMLLVLAALTVAPIRFIYPNLAPRRWRGPLLLGALLWLIVLVAMLPRFPHNPAWLVGLSLAYPAIYTAASFWLARAQSNTP